MYVHIGLVLTCVRTRARDTKFSTSTLDAKFDKSDVALVINARTYRSSNFTILKK